MLAQMRALMRKALAVKLVYQGYKYEEIPTILDVSQGGSDMEVVVRQNPGLVSILYNTS